MRILLVCLLTIFSIPNVAQAAIVTLNLTGTSNNSATDQNVIPNLRFFDMPGNFTFNLWHDTESDVFYQGNAGFNDGSIITEEQYLAMIANDPEFNPSSYIRAGRVFRIIGSISGSNGVTALDNNIVPYNLSFSRDLYGDFDIQNNSITARAFSPLPDSQNFLFLNGTTVPESPLTFRSLVLTVMTSRESMGAIERRFELTSITSQSLTINEVPLPAGLWLFGAGIAALGAQSHKRKVHTV